MTNGAFVLSGEMATRTTLKSSTTTNALRDRKIHYGTIEESAADSPG
jgi:hypothetical protein